MDSIALFKYFCHVCLDYATSEYVVFTRCHAAEDGGKEGKSTLVAEDLSYGKMQISVVYSCSNGCN